MFKRSLDTDLQEKGNQSFLRSRNTARIFEAFRKNDQLSRPDLVDYTRLDKKTVFTIVNDLLAEGMIRAYSRQTDGAGRPKEILGINGDFGRYAGIDLGGTHLSGVIVDFAGQRITSKDIEVHNGMEPDTLMKLCIHLMENMFKETGFHEYDLSGIGISCPGTIDFIRGPVSIDNFPKWQNIPIQEMFQEQYHLPVYIDNDSHLMALAELWFGKGKGCKDFIVANLGFGIGCGIVVEGMILLGSNGKSGEIGHTIIDVNGPLCTCGLRGCIESIASGWALSRDAQRIRQQHPNTLLNETADGPGETISFDQVILAANLGDKYCTELLRKSGEYIGMGLSNAACFFNPSKLILGGRLIQDNEIILRSIIDTVNKRCMKQILEDMKITVSDLGVGASAWGAAISCILNAENSFFVERQSQRPPA
jgi:glucokinase-like ROK family protein